MGWLFLMRTHYSISLVTGAGLASDSRGDVLAGSFFLFVLTFRENCVCQSNVRVQQDEDKQWCHGQYHYVRHPMYAAALLFLLGTTLLAGRILSMVCSLGTVDPLGMIADALLEERTLQEHCRG